MKTKKSNFDIPIADMNMGKVRKNTILRLMGFVVLCFIATFSNFVIGQTYKTVTEIKYDSVIVLNGEYFAVKSGEKWGVIKGGKVILPALYDEIESYSDGMITFINDSLAGFSDSTGKIIKSAQYPLRLPYQTTNNIILNLFDYGSALVYQEGKLTLIDKNGSQFMDISKEIVSKAGNTVVFKKDAGYGMTDAMGNITANNKYRQIQTIIAGGLYSYIARKDGMDLMGLIDASGQEKSAALYDQIIIINKNNKFYIKAFAVTGKQALYSFNGDEIFRPLYQNLEPSPYENYYFITENSKKGVITQDYNIIIQPDYEDIQIVTLNKDTFFIAKQDEITYIINKNNRVTDNFFGNIKDLVSFEDGSLMYIADSMLNYGIRKSGYGWVLPPQYSEIFAKAGDYIIAKNGRYWGALDLKQNKVADFVYSKVKLSTDKRYIVLYGNKKNSVIIDEHSKITQLPATESLFAMKDFIEYKQKKEWIRKYFDGRQLANKYSMISSDVDGVACVKDKKGWTYVNSYSAEPLTDKHFDYAGVFNGNKALVIKDNQLVVIDNHFNTVDVLLEGSLDELKNDIVAMELAEKLNRKHVIIKANNGKYGVMEIIK